MLLRSKNHGKEKRTKTHRRTPTNIERRKFPFHFVRRRSSQLSLATLSTHLMGISSETYYESFCASYFRFAGLAFRFTVHLRIIIIIILALNSDIGADGQIENEKKNTECNSTQHRGCDL